MEQDNQIQKESEENEYGEINANLPFPKVLSQYYVPRDAEDPSYIQSFSIDEPDKVSFSHHFPNNPKDQILFQSLWFRSRSQRPQSRRMSRINQRNLQYP